MHESHTGGDRSSAGSNSVGGSASGDNFSSIKISSGVNDCSIAAAAAAAAAAVQSSCAKNNRDDYENSNRKNNLGAGGSNNTVSYADFSARQMTPIGTSGANGESVGVVAGGQILSHSGGSGGGGGKSRLDTGIPDDSKLLANPKGIIKSFLPQVILCLSISYFLYITPLIT